MKLVIAAVGRLKLGPERELAARYRDRAASLGQRIGLRSIDVVEIPESRARRAEDRLAEEGAVFASFLPENAVIVVLDARGKPMSSTDFAERLRGWRDRGISAVTFLIGGADGLSGQLRDRADAKLSFGAATWPHQLLRIMLLEQVYRAMTILSGHPYHRA
jgi:23S rRNA (pseudouridine1915-N3)-methyltransferase